MPDISMCQDTTCPGRMHCYRYRAEPKPMWQCYANFSNERTDTGCSHFIQVDPLDRVRPEGDLK